MTPVTGFMPDADKNTPGLIVDCANLIPYESGMRAAPSPVSSLLPALAAACNGAVVATLLDGTRRVFAGTQTNLYELVSSVWTSRGSGFTGSAETRWSFCQFGNTTIASNLADAMQSSASGAFAAIAGAPKAKIVVSASNNFVIAFNTDDATYGASTDRWWCCAQNDQTSWTPSVATSAATGRLVSVEGAIEAALPLGNYVIAYKKRGLFIGSYAGPPVVWQWELVTTNECGCVGQDAVCDIGGLHFFVSDDNFWLFDGTRPVPIGDGVVRNWFNSACSPQYRHRVKCTYDRGNNVVRVSFPSHFGGGICDSVLVYHVIKKQWGRNDITIESQVNYISQGVTIDGLDAYGATIDSLPEIPIDSPFWLFGGRVSAYFDGTHTLMSINGAAGSSSFTTGDFGDDQGVSVMDKFRPRFEQSPTSATAQGYSKMNEGDALAIGAYGELNDGKFDLRQSGRFHRVTVSMTGDAKLTAYKPSLIVAGAR